MATSVGTITTLFNSKGEKEVVASMNKVEREAKATSRSVDQSYEKMENDSKKSNKEISESNNSAGLSFSAITAGITAAITGFMLMGEATTKHTNSLNAITNAYGENEAAATKYAETTAASLGVTTTDFLTQSAAMSVTAENYGMTTDAANKYGLAVATVGGALGAVNVAGLSAKESTVALSAAMRGEAESAEALGLSLGDTAMANYVAANSNTAN
jgi:hypothetical protein